MMSNVCSSVPSSDVADTSWPPPVDTDEMMLLISDVSAVAVDCAADGQEILLRPLL